METFAESDPTRSSWREKSSDIAHPTDAVSIEPIPFNAAETQKLLTKLDLHLIPILALIYLLCFLDRTNVGNARLVNLEKDLHMKGLEYNIALAIFFPFCIAANIPSNLAMKRFRPSIWLTALMVVWGTIMISMGLVRNLGGLLACRSLLGLAEGGMFPGASYFITMWYRRHECGFRMALFFSAATIAGAFGGLLARIISEMHGVAGLAGWSWIFILEGLMTVFVSLFSHWAIVDYPATFLTNRERIEVQRRLKKDTGLSDEFDLKYLVHALGEWKIWVNMFITIGIFTPLYSFSLFLPTIIRDLGYSNNKAQLMSVPPYVAACICTIGGGYAADKAGQRGVFLLGFQVVAIVGFLMLVTSNNSLVQYAGTFVAASGIYPLVPLIGVWNSNNVGGSLKRGVGIAMQVSFGNLGGVISGFMYLNSDAPTFITGHCILIGLVSMSFVLTSCMTTYYRRENARRDAYCVEHGVVPGEYTDEIRLEEREKGDYAMSFRYTI